MAKISGDPALRQRIRELKKRTAYLCDVCVCGRTFGFHGAIVPHTHMGNEDGHPECNGFKKAEARAREGR